MADVSVNTTPDSIPGEQFATAVVDGVLGLGQDIVNNNYARKEAKRQYERQKQFARLQFNQQKEFWKMQNEYNTPKQQRSRFNEAGLNPAAAVGQIASGGTAQGLSSVNGNPVPGNEYAQQGFIRLQGIADVLETVARIEKLGADTGLATEQMASEGLRQVLLGLDIPQAKVNYLLSQYEAEGKKMQLDYLPDFLAHQSTMYDLDEQYRNVEIEHQQALKSLADAQTEESKQNARKLVAETGLAEIKQDTERSIQHLNYQNSYKSKSETNLNRQLFRFNQITENLRVKSLRLANQINATEAQKKDIESALDALELRAKSNDSGDANWWYYVDEGINAIGNILGVALGYVVGSKTKTPSSGISYTTNVAY